MRDSVRVKFARDRLLTRAAPYRSRAREGAVKELQIRETSVS
jgi:hypothetical protein